MAVGVVPIAIHLGVMCEFVFRLSSKGHFRCSLISIQLPLAPEANVNSYPSEELSALQSLPTYAKFPVCCDEVSFVFSQAREISVDRGTRCETTYRLVTHETPL